jgi:uncharacterized protein (DUF362 family)
MAPKTGMTRREILTGAASAAAAASIGGLAGCFPDVGGVWPDAGPDVVIDTAPMTCGCPPANGRTTDDQVPSTGPVEGKSTVVTIQRDDSVDVKGLSLESSQMKAVREMVDATLSALAGGASNPWPVLLPGAGACTRIGLKVNCLNPYFGTSPALVRAIVGNLIDNLGVCPGNIIVWDRRMDELKTVGKYTTDHLLGAQLMGTIAATNNTSGPGYAAHQYLKLQGSEPKLSRILTELTDVTINCPVLKVHGQTGITAALKNIFGIIDCPGSFHTDEGKGQDIQTALPALYNIPMVRNSLKLTIVDALRAVTNGDTASVPNSIAGRIFASTDPLALDYYALDVINQLRKQPPLRMGPVTNALGWMENAYQLGIGTKGYTLVSLLPNGERATVDGGAENDAAI